MRLISLLLFFLQSGIGAFTIIDDAKVTNADLGNNFFVDQESLGQSRAETVARLLMEMNPFVEGHTLQENPHTLIDERIEAFADFTLVLADSIREPQLQKLAAFLWERKIPLVVTRSYGFIGFVRLVVPEHGVVESHPPDNPDLRIQNPWKELQEFMDSVDLDMKNEALESEKVAAHSHIPWLVLAFRFYHQYRKEHDGVECPRRDFGKYLLDQRVTNSITGGKHIEENFDEAVKNGWRAYSKYSIPAEVQEIMNDPAASSLTASSDRFWFFVAALRKFVAQEGESTFLPLAGGIPDMHSSTRNYIALQKVYQEKAEKDVDAFMGHLEAAMKEAGYKGEPAMREEVKRFCKNAANLRLIRHSPYGQKLDKDMLESMLNNEDEPEKRNVLWYLLILAVQAFESKHARVPGSSDDSVAADVPLLRKEFDAVVAAHQVVLSDETKAQVDDHVMEMVRYGGAELHNIAAFNGGVTSLEIIKVVTRQWVPLAGQFIFNGINGTACTCTVD